MSTPATEIIRYRWLLTISSSRWVYYPVKEPSLSLMLLSWPFIGELAYLLAIVASDMF